MKNEHLTCQRVPTARPIPSLANDVRAGLRTAPRQLPPKYFYDDRGSRLFETLCGTRDYYPSRTEEALLAAHAPRIVDTAAPEHIVELGSGSARKTRHLFDACDRLGARCEYWPFDVSEKMMLDSGADLVARYPWLRVRALAGDYTGGLARLPLADEGRRLIAFLGGTIGNFEPWEARRLMGEIGALLRPGDHFLIGLDRVKDTRRLEAAYDDSDGVGIEFNRNMLHVLNRELDADFPVASYRHRAVYNEQLERIEVYLVASSSHRVTLAALGENIEIQSGEAILTEISRKFTPDSIRALLANGGLAPVAHFEAENGDYSLVLAGCA